MDEYGWNTLTQAEKSSILDGVSGNDKPPGPYHVELQLSDRCLIDCFFCSTRDLRTDEELPTDQVLRLLDEMGKLGTHSITLCGGGEPLFHTEIDRILQAFGEAGLHVDSLTTNGVLLTRERAGLLCKTGCRQVIISLNTADPADYGRMMRVPEKTFETVTTNIQGLLEVRRDLRLKTPKVIIQYLPYKHNYQNVKRMYELGIRLGVDQILYNGLAFLPEDLRMTEEETKEMMGLFEQVLQVDEYRKVGAVHSFEQDLEPYMKDIHERLHAYRMQKGTFGRLRDLLLRDDVGLREKLVHRFELARKNRAMTLLADSGGVCLAPWYTLTVRANGSVPICCVLQSTRLGDTNEQSLQDIWWGDGFVTARREMRDMLLADGEPPQGKVLPTMCSPKKTGDQGCTFRAFYYCGDLPFHRRLLDVLKEMRSRLPAEASV